ncbi:MAG: hypothetical protein ACYS32_16495 [Planctomycetota bacterium]
MAGATRTTMTGATRTINGKDWFDLSADVRAQRGVRCDRGIQGNGPMDRLANEGRAVFAMDNSAGNIGGTVGYYSPGHANARTDWATEEKIRFSFVYGGTAYPQFVGRLTEIAPTAGQYRGRDVRCTAVDFIHQLNNDESADEQSLLTDATSDQGYQAIVDGMTIQPESTSFETGTVTLGNIFHRSSERSGSALEEINRILVSVFDMMWVDRTGALKSINKDNRIKISAGSADYTLNNEITDLSVSFIVSNRADKVAASYYPTKTDTDLSTIFELNSPIRLNPGDSITKKFAYKEANSSKACGASSVTVESYSFGSAEDGVADGLHDDLSITVAAKACVALVTFENTGDALGNINTFKLQGYAITTFDAVEVQDVYNASGGNEIKINMPYQDNAAFAENAVKAISNIYGVESRKVKWVKFNANRSEALLLNAIQTDVNSFIHATETVAGIDDDLFVNGASWHFVAGKKLDYTLHTAPARSGTAGIWNTTKWNQCEWRFKEN